jgi:hypothetical protein
VNSFILRHSVDVNQTKSIPQEGQRLRVPSAFLERIIRNLNEHVQVCVAELVLNLDEVGNTRNGKHISVISCVSDVG